MPLDSPFDSLRGIRSPFGARRRGSTAFDSDASAYISAVETADGAALESGVKTAINDFVVGCKDDGIWSALKSSCILAGARTLNGALVPLVGTAPTNVNFVSADYNRKTGLVGDGTTKYLDSNRANNADPQDSNHNSVYITEAPTGSAKYYMGSDQTNISGVNFIILESDGTGLLVSSRNGSASPTSIASEGKTTGLKGISRPAAGEFDARTGMTTSVVTLASQVPSANNIFVFSRDAGNTPIDARLSFYSVGESIDLAALDTRVSALMTAIDGAIA